MDDLLDNLYYECDANRLPKMKVAWRAAYTGQLVKAAELLVELGGALQSAWERECFKVAQGLLNKARASV